MTSIIKFAFLGVFLVSACAAFAQEEKSNRDTGAATRYWTAPRIEPSLPATPLPAGASQATNLVIENDLLRVTWTGVTLEAVHKASGKKFLSGQFNTAGGVGQIVHFSRKMLGQGDGIEIVNLDGSRDRVMLFPHLPFVLVHSVLTNNGAKPVTVGVVRPFNALVQLDQPASQLKTLGSAGLTAPDKNPGSYDWLAVADPQTRNGVVFGWLTSERGSGVLFDKVEGNTIHVGAQIDYGRLLVSPGKADYLETLAIGYFDDARLGLEAFADTITESMDIALPPQPTVFCTWYAPPPYGGSSDAEHFAENAAFARTNLAPFGLSVLQIDDHWQSGVSTNGPKRGFLEHNPNGGYPDGMKPTADAVKSLGMKAGLWFIPFAGTSYDPIFADHQDWFAKHTDGKPYEVKWGGTCFDLTNPDTRNYISNVVHRITQEWGYDYIKIDGLWTGSATPIRYVNTGYAADGIGDAVLQNSNVSNVEAYRSGLKLVRKAAGHNVFILGCNTPQNMRVYGASMGLVDGMRVGPDNKATWQAMQRGPMFGTRNYFLNGRIWYNDPDPVYVRTNVPLNEARALCSWVAISGAMNTSSEWYPGLGAERLDLLKRTMPAHGLLAARPVDLFDNDLPRAWMLQARTTKAATNSTPWTMRNIVGLFNWEDEESQFDYPLAKLGLDPALEYVAFDYWQDKLLPSFKGDLKVSVPRHACADLAIRPVTNHPQVISTSRHITQGVVDLTDETWDAGTRTLTGHSKVVGGDDYELRIVVPEGSVVQEVSAGQADGTPSVKQDGTLVRVKLQPITSHDTDWAVKFK